MDVLKDPPADIVCGLLFDEVPPGTTLDLDDSRRAARITHSIIHNNTWAALLGLPLSVLYGAVQHTSMIVLTLVQGMLHPGFLKITHFRIADEFLERLKAADPVCGQDEILSSQASIHYLAEKAFVWGSDIHLGEIPFCSFRNLVVCVDPSTRKPAPLEAGWHRGTGEFMAGVGRVNKAMAASPVHDTSKMEPIHEMTFDVTECHLDLNNHVNYKMYPFSVVVMIRDALDRSLIAGLRHYRADDVIAKDIFTTYGGESRLGDTLRFTLYQVKPTLFYVECHRQNIRLCHIQCELEVLQPHISKL